VAAAGRYSAAPSPSMPSCGASASAATFSAAAAAAAAAAASSAKRASSACRALSAASCAATMPLYSSSAAVRRSACSATVSATTCTQSARVSTGGSRALGQGAAAHAWHRAEGNRPSVSAGTVPAHEGPEPATEAATGPLSLAASPDGRQAPSTGSSAARIHAAPTCDIAFSLSWAARIVACTPSASHGRKVSSISRSSGSKKKPAPSRLSKTSVTTSPT